MKKSILILLSILTLISCSKDDNEYLKDKFFGQGDSSIPITQGVALNFSVTSINFGTVQNGTTKNEIITITNPNYYSVNIAVSLANTTPVITFNQTNFQIPANGTFEFSVSYSPTATSTLNNSLLFLYNSGNNSSGVNLTGNSVANLPTSLVVTPTGAIDFGNIAVGQSSTRYILLTNVGNAIANWASVGTIMTFNPNSGSIPVGGTQQVAMVFTATSAGLYNNTQTFSYNGGNVQIPYTVNRIAATKIISVSCTTSTAFGNIAINSTSTKIVRITNTGNSPLNVSSIVVQSTPLNQFTCNYSGVIQPGMYAETYIYFKPTATGSKSGNIVVQSDKTSGINSLSFSGFGK